MDFDRAAAVLVLSTPDHLICVSSSSSSFLQAGFKLLSVEVNNLRKLRKYWVKKV